MTISVHIEPAAIPAVIVTDVLIVFHNPTNKAYYRILAEIETDFGITLVKGDRKFEVMTLAPGESRAFDLQLRAKDVGDYLIEFVGFSYRDERGRSHHGPPAAIRVRTTAHAEPGTGPASPGAPAERKPLRQPRIFLSYRRAGGTWFANPLHEYLTENLPGTEIFIDNDIPLGQNFIRRLDDEVTASTVLLALIGPSWLDLRSSTGGRRLDEDDDPVRREIATPLRHGVEIIPVLFDGAKMPDAADLPPDIAPLATLNAAEVQHRNATHDRKRILDCLRDLGCR